MPVRIVVQSTALPTCRPLRTVLPCYEYGSRHSYRATHRLRFDVVFHEYTHGLTNRLVGGTRQGRTLDARERAWAGWSAF